MFFLYLSSLETLPLIRSKAVPMVTLLKTGMIIHLSIVISIFYCLHLPYHKKNKLPRYCIKYKINYM